jgi:hypothetical protein
VIDLTHEMPILFTGNLEKVIIEFKRMAASQQSAA